MDGGFVISLHFFQELQFLSPWFAIFAGNASEYVESDQAIKCDGEQAQRHKRICGSDLRLKITNDFVMALLSRSSSVEILAPQSLKDRMYDIWTAAPGRNK